MPGYHRHKATMTADEYLWKKNKHGKFLDRQVRFYASVPGLKVVRVIPNYFDDPDSDDNGVLLRWRNPFYNWPFHSILARVFPHLLDIEDAYRVAQRRLRAIRK